MPKHIVRLIWLAIIAFVAAMAARVYFIDPSYYRFGNYRADAVVEIAADVPIIQGPESCQSCHAERHLAWSESTHRVVKCEVCHGAAGEHPVNGPLQIPDDPVRLCSQCHEAMPARPANQPQIILGQHPYPSDVVLVCTQCHDSHSPGFGGPVTAAPQAGAEEPEEPEKPEESAGIASLIANCGACHGDRGQGLGAFSALAGKEAEYLAGELNKFKSGTRQEPMMNAIMQPISDTDIIELAEHYASVPPE